ncbi:MAG TPA: DUF1573 domain-containing protein [Chitinophagaceae bacterium]|nr:DUF1573 domain-containing protein [Chitinophagaceae bacterium]
MKSYILLAGLAVVLATSCKNETKEETNSNLLSTDLVHNPRTADGMDPAAFESLPTMDFRDTVFDFGTMKDGEIINHEYEFTNNGKTPLIISNAAGSCGCTVADFPREPIAPGNSGNIKVSFSSAGKEGHQEKSVSLTTNSGRGVHVLYIKGEVTK